MMRNLSITQFLTNTKLAVYHRSTGLGQCSWSLFAKRASLSLRSLFQFLLVDSNFVTLNQQIKRIPHQKPAKLQRISKIRIAIVESFAKYVDEFCSEKEKFYY